MRARRDRVGQERSKNRIFEAIVQQRLIMNLIGNQYATVRSVQVQVQMQWEDYAPPSQQARQSRVHPQEP